MNFISALLSGFAAGAGLIVAIGAQNAFVLRQGLRNEHVAAVVLCCILGDVLCITAGTAGMGALVKAHPTILEWLRWGGAAFLMAYGFFAAKRAWDGGAVLLTEGTGAQTLKSALAACLAFTFLNPHVYLDTVVLLGSLSTQYPGRAAWFFAMGAYAASILWFAGLGFGARCLRPIFAKPQAWRMLDAGIALMMLGLGAALIAAPISV